MKTDQQLADYLREVSIFAITHGGKKCFAWPAHVVFRFLAAHYLNGSLFVAEDAGKITGVAVAWKEGEDLHVRQVVGDRDSISSLRDALLARYAGFRRVFTYRMIKDSPKLVELSYKAAMRFLRNHQPLTIK